MPSACAGLLSWLLVDVLLIQAGKVTYKKASFVVLFGIALTRCVKKSLKIERENAGRENAYVWDIINIK